jgi:hypothetical protein
MCPLRRASQFVEYSPVVKPINRTSRPARRYRGQRLRRIDQQRRNPVAASRRYRRVGCSSYKKSLECLSTSRFSNALTLAAGLSIKRDHRWSPQLLVDRIVLWCTYAPPALAWSGRTTVSCSASDTLASVPDEEPQHRNRHPYQARGARLADRKCYRL